MKKKVNRKLSPTYLILKSCGGTVTSINGADTDIRLGGRNAYARLW